MNKLLYSTVRIDVIIDEKSSISATGFLTEVGLLNHAIITNAHVFQDGLKFPKKFVSASFYVWVIDNDDSQKLKQEEFLLSGNHLSKIVYYSEMGDLNYIDLCAVDIKFLTKRNAAFGYLPLSISVALAAQGQKALDSLEIATAIFMIGYPEGVFDPHSKLPLCLTGHIASNPQFDYQNRKEYLIDIYSTDGSSGSPVFFSTTNTYRNDLLIPGKLIRDTIDIRFIGVFTEFIKANIIDEDGKPSKVTMKIGVVLKPGLVVEMMVKVFNPEIHIAQIIPPDQTSD